MTRTRKEFISFILHIDKKMDIKKHKSQFDSIVKKYGLFDEDKATEVANFLTKEKKVNSEEFAKLFAMKEDEARIFLSFIEKGLQFRKEGKLD